MFNYIDQLHRTGLIFIFGFFLSTGLLAEESYKNEIEIKSGSMLGLVHLSYGRVVADKHHFSLGVGYIPKFDNHHKLTLFSLAYLYQGTTSFRLKKLGPDVKLRPINFGIINIAANNKDLYTKIRQPDQVPDGYYYPTGRRVLFNYQTLIQLNKVYEFYMDFSILDIGLVNYIRNFDFYKDNYGFLGMEGIVNYGFGMRMKF